VKRDDGRMVKEQWRTLSAQDGGLEKRGPCIFLFTLTPRVASRWPNRCTSHETKSKYILEFLSHKATLVLSYI
jgi:hypothetical protein